MLKSAKIKVAGRVVEINTIYRNTLWLCRDFFTDEEADFSITSTQEDIDSDRSVLRHENNDVLFQDGIVEYNVILRKISEELLDYNTLLIHGAAVAVDKEVYLFTAPSGTGKTTHVLKWLENCQNAFVVNGDKPFVVMDKKEEFPVVCGSPWAGKEKMYTNIMLPLKAIIIMERNEDNYIQQISFIEAFPDLYKQVYRPQNELKMKKTLDLLKHFNFKVSLWKFYFNNFKDDCFNVVYNALHYPT